MTNQVQELRFIDKGTAAHAMRYLESVGGPTALGLYLCLTYGDHQEACSHSINPNAYIDVNSFSRDYLSSMFLSKYNPGANKALEAKRKETALSKYLSCEDRLRVARPLFQHALSENSDVSQVLYLAREKMAHILGSVLDNFEVDRCSFGPGSSSSVPRRQAHPSNKFLSADASAACIPFVTWFFSDAGLARPKFNLVEYSRICFVPKNFKTDRIIGIEPDWNIFIQKGLGHAIRRCLRRVGLDLDTIAEKHAIYAMKGSVDGRTATVDLSSASDSISLWLMRFLLPEDWFFALNSVRTNCIRIGNETIHLSKFSSMGNGFTFELESLVFFALALSTCEVGRVSGKVSVFGDDIVLPCDAVPLLGRTFTTCGFQLNMEKSFYTGYFRESCGAHFFDGYDVKPVYLKDPLTNDFQKFKFCNSVRRLSLRCLGTDVHRTILRLPYAGCVNDIRRIYSIPEGVGDGGLVRTFDEATPAALRGKDRTVRRHPDCIEGYKVKCLLPVVSNASNDSIGMHTHKLRELSLRRLTEWHSQGTLVLTASLRDLKSADHFAIEGNDYSVSPGGTQAYRVGHMHVRQWTDPQLV